MWNKLLIVMIWVLSAIGMAVLMGSTNRVSAKNTSSSHFNCNVMIVSANASNRKTTLLQVCQCVSKNKRETYWLPKGSCAPLFNMPLIKKQ